MSPETTVTLIAQRRSSRPRRIRQEMDAVTETLLERLPVSSGRRPFAGAGLRRPPPGSMTPPRVVTSLLVAGPLVALAVFIPLGWGGTKTIWGLGFAAAFYLFTGFGISVGFHRLFAHRSFRAHRVLKIVLAVAGTMALEGSVISWVTTHRRHHMFSDRPGDPHSPVSSRDGPTRRRPADFCGPMWDGCSPPIPRVRTVSRPISFVTGTWSSSTGCSRSWPSSRS